MHFQLTHTHINSLVQFSYIFGLFGATETEERERDREMTVSRTDFEKQVT